MSFGVSPRCFLRRQNPEGIHHGLTWLLSEALRPLGRSGDGVSRHGLQVYWPAGQFRIFLRFVHRAAYPKAHLSPSDSIILLDSRFRRSKPAENWQK